MYQAQNARTLTKEIIENYATALREDEKSNATITKYNHDLNMTAEYFSGVELSKSALIKWKDMLAEKYAAASGCPRRVPHQAQVAHDRWFENL